MVSRSRRKGRRSRRSSRSRSGSGKCTGNGRLVVEAVTAVVVVVVVATAAVVAVVVVVEEGWKLRDSMLPNEEVKSMDKKLYLEAGSGQLKVRVNVLAVCQSSSLVRHKTREWSIGRFLGVVLKEFMVAWSWFFIHSSALLCWVASRTRLPLCSKLWRPRDFRVPLVCSCAGRGHGFTGIPNKNSTRSLRSHRKARKTKTATRG